MIARVKPSIVAIGTFQQLRSPQFAFRGTGFVVGDGSLVNRGVYLDNRAGLTIGRHVSIAHDCRIYTLGHDVHDPSFVTKGAPVRIDDHAVMFAGAMLMPGVHLGAGAVVMAGSVVVKDVPAGRIVGGNPARDLGPRRIVPDYRLGRRHWFAH